MTTSLVQNPGPRILNLTRTLSTAERPLMSDRLRSGRPPAPRTWTPYNPGRMAPDASLSSERPGPRVEAPGSDPNALRTRGGFRRGSSGFEAEFSAYLQERLALCCGVLFCVVLGLLLMHAVLAQPAGPDYVGYWSHPSTFVHASGLLYLGVQGVLLKRRRWSPQALLLVDAVLMASILVSCGVVYALTYELGNPSLVPMLGLFLVTRAVVVPSRARRTFWGCAPAPLMVLGIQLAHGYLKVWHGLALPAAGFPELVAWDFMYLTLCAAVAVVASRVNFRLRVSAYEARQLDQYVLEGLIGKGAMGEVHRAQHALMRRPTAIKLVRGEVLTPQMVKRFEQEVRQTSRLTHPNTIRVYDYGQTADGTFYYAMELLEGADLERVVEVAGPLPPARVVHLLVQAAGALAEAHAAGLVHRDVKASNLLLCRQGLVHDVVKVMDFGLVRDTTSAATLSSPDEICGSPHTISPEVVQGEPATAASDLYALGAVGCWLLTGKPVFDASHAMEMVLAHVQRPPIKPSARGVSVPADLERLLLACLAKRPEDRPASADALRRALLACADVGTWTDADAAAWWATHGEKLRAAQDAAAAT
jgi:eukaryotic-like serine/threonine-protein kinase